MPSNTIKNTAGSPLLTEKEKQLAEMQLFIQSTYRTHTSVAAEWLHLVSAWLVWPMSLVTRGIGYVVEPTPGANKKLSNQTKLLIRSTALLAAVIGLLPSAVFLVFGLILRLIDHPFRPEAHFLVTGNLSDYENNPIALTHEQSLHIRTHNVAFVPPIVRVITDIRNPVTRAAELVRFILGDPKQPDIICFQEAALSNEDALKALVTGIAPVYQFIIHDVKHSRWGLTSGAMVASKYPIKYEGFYLFDHMVPGDKKAPRGILKASLNTTAGTVMLYNIHTQSLLGYDRAQARLAQIQDVYRLVIDDCAKYGPSFHPIVLGDFNTSRITHWGEDNLTPPHQAEASVLHYLSAHFEDPFLNNHDAVTGARTSGTPIFLSHDQERTRNSAAISHTADQIEEPRGTLYQGPFSVDRGFFMNRHLKNDQQQHGFDTPVQAVALPASQWGGMNWEESRATSTARMDYVLFPVIPERTTALDTQVEIRHIVCDEKLPSASSDHHPVDAVITLKR